MKTVLLTITLLVSGCSLEGYERCVESPTWRRIMHNDEEHYRKIPLPNLYLTNPTPTST